jgi:hypothetical protein
VNVVHNDSFTSIRKHTMKINVPRVAVALTAGALLVPAVAAARPGDGDGYGNGKGKWQEHGQSQGHGKGHGHGGSPHKAPADPATPVAPATEPGATAPDATQRTAPTTETRTARTTTRGKAYARTKGKTFLFRGRILTVDAAAGTVTVDVRGGNRLARRFRGETVTFELSSAKIRAIEADGLAGITTGDLLEADRVIIQARLPRSTQPDGSTIAAHRVMSLTDREPAPIVEPTPTEPVVEPAPADPVVTEPAPTV